MPNREKYGRGRYRATGRGGRGEHPPLRWVGSDLRVRVISASYCAGLGDRLSLWVTLGDAAGDAVELQLGVSLGDDYLQRSLSLVGADGLMRLAVQAVAYLAPGFPVSLGRVNHSLCDLEQTGIYAAVLVRQCLADGKTPQFSFGRIVIARLSAGSRHFETSPKPLTGKRYASVCVVSSLRG